MVQDGCCVACGYLLMEKLCSMYPFCPMVGILHHFSIRR